MSVDAGHEAPRAPARPGFGDVLAFAFAAGEGSACGIAELGIQTGGDGQRHTHGHALLFWERRLAASASQPETVTEPNGWEQISAAGIRTAVLEPLTRWSLTFRDERGDGFELEFTALNGPAVLNGTGDFARASGVEGYEQLCRVSGTVTVAGRVEAIEGLGQRGHRWGSSDANGAELTRHVDAWLDPGTAVILTAVRPRGAAEHDREATSAFLIEADSPTASPVAGARLSTTYDRDGHPVRAGVELWPSPDAEFPRRLAGEAICRGLVPLEGQQVECVFLAWRMEGRSGVGRYELRRPK